MAPVPNRDTVPSVCGANAPHKDPVCSHCPKDKTPDSAAQMGFKFVGPIANGDQALLYLDHGKGEEGTEKKKAHRGSLTLTKYFSVLLHKYLNLCKNKLLVQVHFLLQ